MDSASTQSWFKSSIRAVLLPPNFVYRKILEFSTIQDTTQSTPSFRYPSHQAQREQEAVPAQVEAIVSTKSRAASTRRSS